MIKTILNTFLAASFLAGFPVKASTIYFSSTAPFGTLGVSQAYATNGMTITARGYSGMDTPGAAGVATALYAKTSGGDETGLGIDQGRDREIVGNYFIQLDFTDVQSKMMNPTGALMLSSVQDGEAYSIYGSNNVGVPGTQLIKSGTLDSTFFSVPVKTYSYISIGAPTGNVLLDAVSLPNSGVGSVPEPGTLTLFAGTALCALGLSRRVRRTITGKTQQR